MLNISNVLFQIRLKSKLSMSIHKFCQLTTTQLGVVIDVLFLWIKMQKMRTYLVNAEVGADTTENELMFTQNWTHLPIFCNMRVADPETSRPEIPAPLAAPSGFRVQQRCLEEVLLFHSGPLRRGVLLRHRHIIIKGVFNDSSS